MYVISLIFHWIAEIKCCHSVASLCQLTAQGAAHISSTTSHKCPPASHGFMINWKGSLHVQCGTGKDRYMWMCDKTCSLSMAVFSSMHLHQSEVFIRIKKHQSFNNNKQWEWYEHEQDELNTVQHWTHSQSQYCSQYYASSLINSFPTCKEIHNPLILYSPIWPTLWLVFLESIKVSYGVVPTALEVVYLLPSLALHHSTTQNLQLLKTYCPTKDKNAHFNLSFIIINKTYHKQENNTLVGVVSIFTCL